MHKFDVACNQSNGVRVKTVVKGLQGAPPRGEAWRRHEGSPLALYWRFIGLLRTALIITKRVLHQVSDG